jgi:hypothetical protein
VAEISRFNHSLVYILSRRDVASASDCSERLERSQLTASFLRKRMIKVHSPTSRRRNALKSTPERRWIILLNKASPPSTSAAHSVMRRNLDGIWRLSQVHQHRWHRSHRKPLKSGDSSTTAKFSIDRWSRILKAPPSWSALLAFVVAPDRAPSCSSRRTQLLPHH